MANQRGVIFNKVDQNDILHHWMFASHFSTPKNKKILKEKFEQLFYMIHSLKSQSIFSLLLKRTNLFPIFDFIISCLNFILLHQIPFLCVLRSVTFHKNPLPNLHLAIKANSPKKSATTSHSWLQYFWSQMLTKIQILYSKLFYTPNTFIHRITISTITTTSH